MAQKNEQKITEETKIPSSWRTPSFSLLPFVQFRCVPASRLSTETSEDQISGFEKLAFMSED